MVDLKKAREVMVSYYHPEPEHFEVWFDKEDDMYKSIAKFKDCDAEIIVAVWNEDYECDNEIFINKDLFNKIKNIMEAK